VDESARRLVDIGSAAALAGLAQLEVWTSPAMGVGDAAVAAVATLPLAARRVAPVPVLAICVGTLTLLTVQRSDAFTVAQLLALMLATYTVANRHSWRTSGVALVVVTAAGVANSVVSGSSEVGDYLFPVILLGIPWAAGTALQLWQRRAMELRRLTEELRRERELVARLAVTAERGRIARNLHDSLAQSLNAVVVHAEAAQAALEVDPSRRAHHLRGSGRSDDIP
jgi:signal transduction histidine kinase